MPKSTQVEIYAVLRAGRYPIRVNGKKIFKPFTHDQIIRLVRRYEQIFEMPFLDGFKTANFPSGNEYKDVLFENMKHILSMDIKQSKQFVQNKGIDVEKYKDEFDFHIMVATFKCNADYLVTQNTDDFPNPLGKCKVITVQELPAVLPIYP